MAAPWNADNPARQQRLGPLPAFRHRPAHINPMGATAACILFLRAKDSCTASTAPSQPEYIGQVDLVGLPSA